MDDPSIVPVYSCHYSYVSIYLQIQFVKVNTDLEELKSLAEMLGVDRLPYFHFYKGNDGLVTHFSASLHPCSLDRLRKAIIAHKP
jgi:hypothetical protein